MRNILFLCVFLSVKNLIAEDSAFNCAKIDSDKERLACYDNIFKIKEDLNEEIETLAGFIVSIAGRVPVKGEVIKYSPSGLKFEILEADPRKVILVKLTGLDNMTYLNKLKL